MGAGGHPGVGTRATIHWPDKVNHVALSPLTASPLGLTGNTDLGTIVPSVCAMVELVILVSQV